MKNTREYHRRYYYTQEKEASLPRGNYAGVKIEDYDGEKMVLYLRHIITKKLLKIHSKYIRNAINRKLKQYEGVQWFYGKPTKKPKKRFDYIKKMFE